MADESRQFTERQQALIDGVEFGIDYGLEVAPEDIEEYHRLTGSSCNMLKSTGGMRNEKGMVGRISEQKG